MGWTEMSRYRTSTADGNIEDFVLERDDEGNFRIKNDFGNIVIDFERMSGYEFFRKVKRDIEDDIEDELNNIWGNVDYADDCDDSDSQPFTSGHDVDSDHYGAD